MTTSSQTKTTKSEPRSREWRIGPLLPTPKYVADAVEAMLMNEYRGITVNHYQTKSGSAGLRIEFEGDWRKEQTINVVITKAKA